MHWSRTGGPSPVKWTGTRMSPRRPGRRTGGTSLSRSRTLRPPSTPQLGMARTRRRNRFKSILEDRDTQITNLKIECDMYRSQHVQATKEEEEDLKQKHMDQVQM